MIATRFRVRTRAVAAAISTRVVPRWFGWQLVFSRTALAPKRAAPHHEAVRLPLLLTVFPWWFLGCAGSPDATGREVSVKPGINDNFLDPELDVGDFEERFEGDNREVFVHRARVAHKSGIQPGADVADIGAGTGLFTRMFSRRVGAEGKVYAVEISPRFAEHLRRDAQQRSLDNVEVVLCSERDVQLPEASIDLAFVCDTYHHFEYPKGTLRSIYRALRPGGELVIVDFRRIPGVSRPWILGHVRAGQEQVEAEIAAEGFLKVQEELVPQLRENYLVRFRRP